MAKINKINGGKGDDILSGTNSADKIVGKNGNDMLLGSEGNDVLFGDAYPSQASGSGKGSSGKLRLDMTLTEWLDPIFQQDLAAYLDYLADPTDHPFSLPPLISL